MRQAHAHHECTCHPYNVHARKQQFRALVASVQIASPVCSRHKPHACILCMSAALENNLLNGSVIVPRIYYQFGGNCVLKLTTISLANYTYTYTRDVRAITKAGSCAHGGSITARVLKQTCSNANKDGIILEPPDNRPHLRTSEFRIVVTTISTLSYSPTHISSMNHSLPFFLLISSTLLYHCNPQIKFNLRSHENWQIYSYMATIIILVYCGIFGVAFFGFVINSLRKYCHSPGCVVHAYLFPVLVYHTSLLALIIL